MGFSLDYFDTLGMESGPSKKYSWKNFWKDGGWWTIQDSTNASSLFSSLTILHTKDKFRPQQSLMFEGLRLPKKLSLQKIPLTKRIAILTFKSFFIQAWCSAPENTWL